MRLVIQFSSFDNQEIRLPIHYNQILQAVIYGTLNEEFAQFLHDQGYEGGGRRFKLFTFSRLMGKFRLSGEDIYFDSKICLVVASPVEYFCQHLLNGLLSKAIIRIGAADLRVDTVRAEGPMAEGGLLKIRTLSPVVAYSTLLKPDGRHYTCYYQPGEREFDRVAGENLRKKYQAIYEGEPPAGGLIIRPLKQLKLHVVNYKGNVIKGYAGLLEIQGPQELLQIALDAGLGSKNSMGFGCTEKIMR